MRHVLFLLLVSFTQVFAATPPTQPTPPTATEVLAKVDAILSPPEFEARLTFVSYKAKGSARTWSMRLLKKDSDKFRVWFLTPADEQGQEVLRVKDDMWTYLPDLKRSLKISTRQDFHGGDFANSDVLQVDFTRDYTAAFAETTPEGWVLELTARNDAVTYARVKVKVRRDFQPLQLEFFSGAGKLVRSMTLSEPKALGSLVRPTKWVMVNMLEPKRRSELTWDSVSLRHDLELATFDQAALGR